MLSAINFFNEEINFVLRDKTAIREWLVRCARKEKKKIDSLNYIFCSDRYLRKINKQFLNHDYNTDIVTFPDNSSDGKTIGGEMYISIDRVKTNAAEYSVTFNNELHRVMVHGLLHLCGYDDKDEKSRSEMRKREDVCLGMKNQIIS